MFHIWGDVDYLKNQVEKLKRELQSEREERERLESQVILGYEARLCVLEKYAAELAGWHESLSQQNGEEHAALRERIEQLELLSKRLEQMLIHAVNNQLGEVSVALKEALEPENEPEPEPEPQKELSFFERLRKALN